ncbi:MAG: hypothetical protein IKA02_03155 [Clostridia bacterium]|nr:hypothetical protein [Clostridia bacterium]
MKYISGEDICVGIDNTNGTINSLSIKDTIVSCDKCPIFVLRLRDKDGNFYYLNSTEMNFVDETYDKFTYKVNKIYGDISVCVSVSEDKHIAWGIEVCGVNEGYAIEWIEFPKICLPRLIDNNENGGKIVFPYNEGMLVSDETLLPRYEMEFPMSGAYFIFPNMVCSQFFAYLFNDFGLYIGAHDTKRAFKGIDFYRYNEGIAMQIRIYSGCNFGDGFKLDYPIVWSVCDGNWKSATDIYRNWFENNLPENVVSIKNNKCLPKWYEDTPVIVTYPIRGIHDTDKMEPNALFPYKNALPILNRIKKETNCHVMSLLMHWEGTAPWAPPYVWPPFGGVEIFNEFRDELHKNGDLLGVYCSGFGYTKQSTLIESYNCEEKIKNENVLEGVCYSPENKPELGRTCTPYQRYGYDICPASKRGKELINEGFSPLFKSGIDYAQILDQNHGGGQYMCFAREHNHPPMPGVWMTTNMQDLLSKWNRDNPTMLFGCESAASEPFIGNLLMSDNRFELNYPFGDVIPVYAYLYHEYVRNFMGNQCGCPFEPNVDTLRYRLAYSFSIGDMMTLIIAPNGNLMSHWGTWDFENCPDMNKTLTFIKNVMKFYSSVGKEFLYDGKMSNAKDIECENIEIPLYRGRKVATLPRLLSSVWEVENGKNAYVVVNPEDEEVKFHIGDEEFSVNALNATLIIR